MFEVGCDQHLLSQIVGVEVNCVDQRGEAATCAATVHRGTQHTVVPHDELERVARGGRDHESQVPGMDGAQAVVDIQEHRDHPRHYEPELFADGQE